MDLTDPWMYDTTRYLRNEENRSSSNDSETGGGTQGIQVSQLGEVALVAACPVIILLLLCCCLVCLAVRRWDEAQNRSVQLPVVCGTVPTVARPLDPPSYAVACSDAHIPPPLYEDVKDLKPRLAM